jgi:hypothetical protein
LGKDGRRFRRRWLAALLNSGLSPIRDRQRGVTGGKGNQRNNSKQKEKCANKA